MSSSPYTWLRRLGSGSSGVVWAVERDGRQFAVKILRASPSPAHREAVRRECRIGPLIADHPGVVAVRYVEEIAEVLHLEMDLVRGPSLSQVLKGRLEDRKGPLPASVVVPWMVQVLDALHWVGSRVAPDRPDSFLHRDLKPANLLLDPSGRVRITDFGIARAEVDLGFQTTNTGIVKGSPRFMAPEVLLEKQPDARADQFSVGVVLFELLTGVPLYIGRDLAETLMLAVQADVERRMQIVRGPAALVDVLRRMLKRDPDARFPDALAAVDALLAVDLTGPTAQDLLPELLSYGQDADDVGVDETGEITSPVDEQDAGALTDPGFVPRSSGDTFSFLGAPGATVEGTLHRMAMATFVPADDAPTIPGTLDEALKPGFDEMDSFSDADAITDIGDLLDEATPPVRLEPPPRAEPPRVEAPRIEPQRPALKREPPGPVPLGGRPGSLPSQEPTEMFRAITLDDQLAAFDRKNASEAPTQVLERDAIHAEIQRAMEAPTTVEPTPTPTPHRDPPRPVSATITAPLPDERSETGTSPTGVGWVKRADEPWLLVLALLAIVFGLVGVVGVAVLAFWWNASA